MRADSPTPPEGPVRMCIGCRTTAPRSALVRIVLANDSRATARVDVGKCAPGRGAWLHCNTGCLEQAERRRAFFRALRCAAGVSTAEVRSWFAEWSGT